MILKWMNYNTFYVYTLNPDQNKYKFLQEQGIEILSPEDISLVEELDSQQKVIVFDDIKLENMNKNKGTNSLCLEIEIVIVFISSNHTLTLQNTLGEIQTVLRFLET